MSHVGVDQMRLVAIVSNIDRPRAMLVDPAGVGHVVERGDYIGRAETIQTGGEESVPVALNWRIDRIRETEVVLMREDPGGPERAPHVRVLPLHEEEVEEERE
jgi:type IV pilus assembly protein PilP